LLLDGGGAAGWVQDMPRTALASVGGVCYHVLNRGNGRTRVFRDRDEYAAPADRPAVYRRLLDTIARHRNPLRPGRTEPRLVKRDPVGYCFLTIPRDKARQQCLS